MASRVRACREFARRRRSGRLATRRFRGNGAVVLELILALPILVIVLLAIVEFGILLSNLQHLESASRSGAHVASQLNQSDFYSSGVPVFPPAILTAVNMELDKTNPGSAAPLTAAKVYLEHRVPSVGSGVDPVLRQVCAGTAPSPCNGSDVVDSPMPNTYRYVRVTVFVDAPRLTPNLLATFGIDLNGKRFQQTTTFAYLK